MTLAKTTDLPKTALQPSKRTLRKAAKLLQAAHDHIETMGFDINTYAQYNAPFNYDHEIDGARCYIGHLRYAAGVPSMPEGIAAEGDGPELIVALQAMDKIAQRRLRRTNPNLTPARFIGIRLTSDFEAVGHFVESLGFQIQAKAYVLFPLDSIKQKQYQTTYALRLLRRALTEIYADPKLQS